MTETLSDALKFDSAWLSSSIRGVHNAFKAFGRFSVTVQKNRVSHAHTYIDIYSRILE